MILSSRFAIVGKMRVLSFREGGNARRIAEDWCAFGDAVETGGAIRRAI